MPRWFGGQHVEWQRLLLWRCGDGIKRGSTLPGMHLCMQENAVPQFGRVPTEEAALYFFKRGQMVLSEYEAFLADLSSGDVGKVEITSGEIHRAVKRRLSLAAKSLDQRLQYSKRAAPGTIVFRVR